MLERGKSVIVTPHCFGKCNDLKNRAVRVLEGKFTFAAETKPVLFAGHAIQAPEAKPVRLGTIFDDAGASGQLGRDRHNHLLDARVLNHW